MSERLEASRLVLAGLVVAAFATAAVAQQASRTGPTAPELAEGKAVFAKWCAPCHAPAPGLAGTFALQHKYEGTVPAALEDRTDLQPALVAYFVRNGVAWMPPFRPTEISDQQLAALSAYLTAPLDQRGAPAELLAEEMVKLRGEGQ
ncbi:cytochrome c [Aurantiacibacter xanthus]|uniref:Cytochrome c n=1 Tax=Aurantiacibacter xanthus TaxID=1784712 RepID=A0A3A1P172_9SPHN|nr:cytochrome c [Aurantiacibacter xanthus]RIV81072.1 cytochrome c [Aurantiacibacter xanthus]